MKKQIAISIISFLFLFAYTTISFAGPTKCTDNKSDMYEIPVGRSVKIGYYTYTYGGYDYRNDRFLLSQSESTKIGDTNSPGMIHFPSPDSEQRVFSFGGTIPSLEFQVIKINPWYLRIRVLCEK